MGFLTSRQKMGGAALIMAVSILLSRFMGLARDKVISWQFGTGGDADVYFAAFVVPDFLNYLLAGGYLSITLIPLLSSRFLEDEKDGWRFFSAIFCWSTLAIGLLSLVAWIFAPGLAHMVAPGFDGEQSARLASFLRIILPAQVFFLPGACLSALLYIRRQFAVPALIPLIYNGFILLCGVSMPWLGLTEGMEGFCWGVTLGAGVGAFALPLYAVRKEAFHFAPSLYHPMLKPFVWLALPLMLGQSVVVLDEQFIRIFGSMAGDGAVSLLSYARRVMMVPVGVVAQAAGVASFPFLAALAAKGDEPCFQKSLGIALRNSLILVLPMSAFLVLCAHPLMGFIFEGGSFGALHTSGSAPLLQIMLLAVPCWTLQQVVGRAFYARKDTLSPTLVGTGITLSVVPLYFWLAPVWGAAGVALITSLSHLLYAGTLLVLWRIRGGAESLHGLAGAGLKSLVLALPGCAWTYGVVAYGPKLLPPAFSPLLEQFLTLLGAGLGFVALYGLLARFFAPEIWAMILRRGKA